MTHKVLKSCRNKMATLAHDVCDVHGAALLYIKTCWQGLYRVFATGRMGESPHQQKIYSFNLSTKFLFPPTEGQFNLIKNKNILFICSHCSCSIFVLISYSFQTYIILILILIDVRYSQFLNRQNHSSGSHHLVKKSSQQCSLLFDTKSEKLLKF